MHSKKIAIVGSSGYIGSKLLEVTQLKFENVVEINRNGNFNYTLDLEAPEKFNYDILNVCDYVIFTSAISSPDFCAKEYKQAYNINVEGTKYFIDKAISLNCKVLFFSSDAVFGKDLGKPFDENSQTNADTAYGVMKKEIEDKFKWSQLFKAVRLSYVISTNDKFTNYLLQCRIKGEIAQVFHPFYRNSIVIDDVIDSVLWLINNWEEFDSPFLNICGRELVSRVRIVDELNRINKGMVPYNIVQPVEGFFDNRHQVTEMSSLYLHKILENSNDSFSVNMKNHFTEFYNI